MRMYLNFVMLEAYVAVQMFTTLKLRVKSVVVKDIEEPSLNCKTSSLPKVQYGADCKHMTIRVMFSVLAFLISVSV